MRVRHTPALKQVKQTVKARDYGELHALRLGRWDQARLPFAVVHDLLYELKQLFDCLRVCSSHKKDCRPKADMFRLVTHLETIHILINFGNFSFPSLPQTHPHPPVLCTSMPHAFGFCFFLLSQFEPWTLTGQCRVTDSDLNSLKFFQNLNTQSCCE